MKSNPRIQILIMIILWGFICQQVSAQDTFSIVAVDTVTGEIGSAGASCVGPIGGVGAFILSDVIEGIGRNSHPSPIPLPEPAECP